MGWTYGAASSRTYRIVDAARGRAGRAKMSERAAKPKIEVKLPWKDRWDISNDRCSAEAFMELVGILARLDPHDVTKFKVSVWRNPPDRPKGRAAGRAGKL